jgi:hypothetical protein
MDRRLIGITILYAIIFSSYAISFLEQDYVVRLGWENGLIESLGAFFFMISSVLFFVAYAYSSGSGNISGRTNKHKNLFYLALGILCLICFGEELSWGQHIFHWETPEFLREINTQKETNYSVIKSFFAFYELRRSILVKYSPE